MRCNPTKCLQIVSMNQNQTILRLGGNSNDNLHNACRKFYSGQDNHHSWSVLQHIHKRQFKTANKKYACFLLNINNEAYNSFSKYKYIWDEANLKVAVDGSANCLAKRGLIQTADVISGDFDSIDAKLIEKLRCPDEATKLFKSQSTKDQENHVTLRLPQIIETPSQRETDFTKAIRVAMSKRPDINFFFGLYYSDGSRIDHLFGLVNTLHLVKRNIIIVNVHSNTISWILVSGSHTIQKPRGRELCSLVPFTGPTEVKTQGLEYNLSASSTLSFGGLISTSNICREDSKTIIVGTNRELLWSIDVSV